AAGPAERGSLSAVASLGWQQTDGGASAARARTELAGCVVDAPGDRLNDRDASGWGGTAKQRGAVEESRIAAPIALPEHGSATGSRFGGRVFGERGRQAASPLAWGYRSADGGGADRVDDGASGVVVEPLDALHGDVVVGHDCERSVGCAALGDEDVCVVLTCDLRVGPQFGDDDGV